MSRENVSHAKFTTKHSIMKETHGAEYHFDTKGNRMVDFSLSRPLNLQVGNNENPSSNYRWL